MKEPRVKLEPDILAYTSRRTGVKFNTTYLKGASYRFRPINDNFRGIRAGYSGSLKRSKSPSEAGQDYAKYNENYRQNVAETIKHVNNLRILKQTDEDIYKTLPKNFSKFLKGMVMQGKVPDMRIQEQGSKGLKVT